MDRFSFWQQLLFAVSLVIVDEDYIIIGLGEETNIEGIESLRKK